MTLSTKRFLWILHLLAVGLHTCTAVASSLCVSWAFLFMYTDRQKEINTLRLSQAIQCNTIPNQFIQRRGTRSFQCAEAIWRRRRRNCATLKVYPGKTNDGGSCCRRTGLFNSAARALCCTPRGHPIIEAGRRTVQQPT